MDSDLSGEMTYSTLVAMTKLLLVTIERLKNLKITATSTSWENVLEQPLTIFFKPALK